MSLICDYIGAPITKGIKFGIEVEVEVDKQLPEDRAVELGQSFQLPNNWKSVHDGSLRGHSKEYVSLTPMVFKEQMICINELKTYLKGYVVNHNSPRVSTHVHMNMKDLTYIQCMNTKILWWAFENFFVEWCGKARVGNNFCLRVTDATRIVTNTVKDAKHYVFMKRTNGFFTPFENFTVNDSKYSALNVSKMRSLGTFEFRCFAGLDINDTKRFEHWLMQLEKLRYMGQKFEDPQAICKHLDKIGYESFAKEILTDYFLEEFSKKSSAQKESYIFNNEMFMNIVAYSTNSWTQKPEKKKKTTKLDPTNQETLQALQGWLNVIPSGGVESTGSSTAQVSPTLLVIDDVFEDEQL